MNNILAVDVGAGRTKVTRRGIHRGKETWIEYVQPSFAVQLTKSQWDEVTARNMQANGYALINSVPYAFGYTAAGYTLVRPEGAARYTRDYLGAVTAYSCVQVGLTGNVNPVLMHPPSLMNWRADMSSAVAGDWTVTTFGERGKPRHHRLTVVGVSHLDEPLGGLNNLLLTLEGKLNRNVASLHSMMVVDVGAHTTDVAVMLGMELQVSSIQSVRVGVNDLLAKARAFLRSEHKALMTALGNPDIDDARLFSAFQDGALMLGAHVIDMRPFLEPELNRLANEVSDVMRKSDYSLAAGLVITGGGGALLYEQLKTAHRHVFLNNIYLAERPEAMQFANAYGAYKLASALEARKRRKG